MLDLLIIGGGPAGLTAGLYGARAGLGVLLLEGGATGGQAASTEWIENYPGFPEGIGGLELMQRFEEQARRFGLELKTALVETVKLSGPEKVVLAGGDEFKARAVILASGSSPRLIGAPGEERLRGRGVSYCATCDGAFFRDQKVAVVGGGDAAVEEGLFLTRYAKEVAIIHRRDALRATAVLRERARANEKVSYRWSTVVTEIKGGQRVEALRLRNLTTGEEKDEPFDGVFAFIGTDPNTGFLNGEVELDQQGYIMTDEHLNTSQRGVFAAGDARKKFLRQVTTAVGDGALAAMAAERYLAEAPR